MSHTMHLSGLEPLEIGSESLFVNVGERTNVTGSRAFAKLILNDDYAGAVEVARQQVASCTAMPSAPRINTGGARSSRRFS